MNKLAQKYFMFEMVFFGASNNYFHDYTIHTKQQHLLISASTPKRVCDFANQLGDVAHICKTSYFASDVLRVSN